MKILVTGGAGFIGSNLSFRLSSSGHQVKILDDLSNGRIENLDLNSVDFIEGSILDKNLVSKLVREVDAVVHLAALGSVPRSINDPAASLEVNFKGTFNVLEAIKSQKTSIIFSSSSSVYGESKVLPRIESAAPEPRSPYAVSKLAAESLVNSYQYSYGISALTLRFFNVYGPRQSFGHPYAAAIPIFFESILSGKPITIFGDGEQVRDFTYVDYVTEVISVAIDKKIHSLNPLNLGSSTKISINQLVALISKIAKSSPELEYFPERNGDVRTSFANTQKLESLFPGLTPISLEEGLRLTYDWYQGEIG